MSESHHGGHERFVSSEKSSRLITMDTCPSAVGVIPEFALFSSKKSNQNLINTGNNTKMFSWQLFSCLPINLVIVMDNAYYQSSGSRIVCQTSSAPKSESIGIHYALEMNEAELITLMEQHIKDSSCHVTIWLYKQVTQSNALPIIMSFNTIMILYIRMNFLFLKCSVTRSNATNNID